ncbi:ABC transporter permease [Methanosarcina sp. 2.H.T.1A.6]|uniref:ABC transporter permease n=1 Tax=unclassified Methanosarcina TaxID=2644672 RepID=UPI0006222000|nr:MULTISPECIES: ABC transporter permease [unclassified Methanosarcina]KKG12479.1 ABC transporter permease [Methanosarcina sp. 2.H.T.1A.15]KKG18522.1 ABC transporter permease [Methanosarcina sp. 2.H.T.1A.3]KKG21177.1 ABC transporter permease [Methanosarcina sp. 2.H.T.1A.8]KKG22309.1 ABC transporter permease [Methanosarcina sp. 2.H.T.1A.6]
MEKYRNMFVIAQKEFADNIWSPRFAILVLVFTTIVFSLSYGSGIGPEGNSISRGYLDISHIVSLFLPFMGIALGFDAISKERESGSLSVLMTHPIYRDDIIAGKTLGAMITLILVVFISIFTVLGTILLASGTELSSPILNRLVIFAILTYLYLSIFLSLGILSSIVTKNATKSLVYNIAIWVVLCIVFGMICATTASIVTDHKPTDLDNNERFLGLNADIQKLTPAHHYAMAVSGSPSLSWGGVSSERPNVRGIFDMEYTLKQWWNDLWINVLILIITPIFLIIIAFITFLRQDVSKDMG